MVITFKRIAKKIDFLLLSLKNPRLWRYLAISVLSFMLALLLNQHVLSVSVKAIQTIVCILAIVVGIIAFFLAFRIVLTIVLWLTLKRFNGLFLPQTFYFDQNGIKIENILGASVVREWKWFSGWKKSRGEYILKLLPAGVIVIKRVEIPAEQIVDFETLLETNLGKCVNSAK